MKELLPLIGSGLIGTLIGYFVKYFLDVRQSNKIDQSNRKREVYENMANSMNIFISGRNASVDNKNLFLQSYSRLWLWAPDKVVKAVSNYLDGQIKLAKQISVDIDPHISYSSAIIEMRKDLGYKSKKLNNEDYKFVSF